MKYRVKRNCVLFYGSLNKASISLTVGQIWERVSKPPEGLLFQFHRLKRQNVLLEITNEDFERIFEPQESEDNNAEHTYLGRGVKIYKEEIEDIY